jgi:hypothetical protein
MLKFYEKLMNSGGFIPDEEQHSHCPWTIMAEKFRVSENNKNPNDGAAS